MFLSDKKKKALSNLIAYVLLISITISLSVLVYNWLRFYVTPNEIEECPEGVNIVLKDYDCVASDGGGTGWINITLKNKGRFVVDGYVLRVHDRSDAEFGIYTLYDGRFLTDDQSLAPGEEVSEVFDFDDTYDFSEEHILNEITLVEIQPYIIENGKISCQSHSSQTIECK